MPGPRSALVAGASDRVSHGRQQHDRDRHQQIAARRQLPEVEADFGERPDQRRGKHHRIDYSAMPRRR